MDKTDFQLPMVPLKGIVVFPEMVVSFDVARRKSIYALDAAMKRDQKIFVVSQKDLSEKDPDITQLNSIGTIAKIKNILYRPEGIIHLTVEGLERAELISINESVPFSLVNVETRKSKSVGDSLHEVALMGMTKDIFDQYINTAIDVSPSLVIEVESQKDPGKLADIIAYNFVRDYNQKQLLLSELVVGNRLEILISFMLKELDILSLRTEMTQKFKNTIGDENRKMYLKEQLRMIVKELGENFDPLEDTKEMKNKIKRLKMCNGSKEKLVKECDRLLHLPYESQEAGLIKSYLDVCLSLPWGKKTKDHVDIKEAEKILDQDHYGLKKLKERIVEMLAVHKLSANIKGQIICFVGPPGVGKTSIVKSIAKSIGRKYVRISLGGVRDESDIRGHRRTYVGAMPGRIISAMKQAGSLNPLILLDEIDKLCKDAFGDPTAALLEVLDPAQNNTFFDHYLDLPFDLSDVLFITTANDYDNIPLPLLDRMEVIRVDGYTREEKFQIAVRHLIPKELKNNGLSFEMVQIPDDVVKILIDNYTREAGVRDLERKIASVFRKSAKLIISKECDKVVVSENMLEEMLGPKRFHHEMMEKDNEIGVAKGLAWTAVGGEAMPVEVAVLKGNGKIHLTGSLGDIMKESADIAISCIRNQCDKFGLSSKFYKKYDIHVHVPEGAVPKDGPSAGVTLATSVMSALTGLPVKNDIAMTGEITLRGKVLPIGGLKEKSMAAYMAGIKNVIIPEKNKPDLVDVDSNVKKNLNFIAVDNIDKVFENAIVGWDLFKSNNSQQVKSNSNLLSAAN